MNVAGLEPRATVAPATVGELARCVADLYAEGRAFAFVGGGTELALGNVPHALDTVVRTTACDRVVEYSPQDQTITVEAGMTIAAINDELRRNGQFLALDVPEPERTTIGGAIATNGYGARRLRYGSIKDTIVGVAIVRPDGTLARGGGKVVKNVAGFDIPKLMTGSLGTLGAIVSATFRVYPIEERSAGIVVRDATLAQVAQIGRDLLAAQLVPAAYAAYATGGGRYDALVSFEGFASGVAQQLRTATAIAQQGGLDADTLDADALAPYAQRETAIRRGAAWRLTLSAPPTATIAFLGAHDLGATRHLCYPLLGTAFIAADALETATVVRWRAALADGAIIVDAMPPDARATLDAWGVIAPGALALMRRIKTNFDPKGLCNAGRYVGGL